MILCINPLQLNITPQPASKTGVSSKGGQLALRVFIATKLISRCRNTMNKSKRAA